jgi:1,4-dihydroxy-2-naphthoate octaprenyltransferase
MASEHMSEPANSQTRSLLRLARPHFPVAGLLLFVFGAMWAVLLGAPLSLPRLLLGYLIVLPAHLSVSFSNDYFDTEVDRLGTPTLFTGGSGVLVEHPELRPLAKRIAIGLMLLSVAIGILFTVKYSYPMWFLGAVVMGNLVGWFYSAPPLEFSYRGLGEVTNAAVIGLLVPGFGCLVMAGTLDAKGLLFAIPLILYGLAFIVTVEIPDEEADRLGNKRTWVARRGRRFGFTAVGLFLLAATVCFMFLARLPDQQPALDFRVFLLLSLLPLAAGTVGVLRRPADRLAATRIANLIVSSLMVFIFAIDGVVIAAALR